MSSYPMESLAYRNPYDGKGVGKSDFNSKEKDEMEKHQEEEEEDETWKSELYDFCQNTTIHGLRQITEPTPFTLRRVIWLLILLGGIALFIYQLVASVIYYLSWPVAVNVKINYNETLRFPAITICNQNAFRSTVTAESGQYNMLTDLYTHQGEHDFHGKYGHLIANLSMKEIFLSAAHTKQDMIVSCSWDGKPCSVEDFVTTFTDHGVCYTFNSGLDQEHIQMATRTGANHGLRIQINIEQYEYMSGPNEGAGLKLLLHDQFDQPLVRDLGQAIPPGSHAFVGVQIIEVRNLKPPHGVCNDSVKLEFFDKYTMASCLIDHQQRVLRDNCSCRLFYMPQGISGQLPVCSVKQMLDCVNPTIGTLSATHDQKKTNCPVPCKRNHYDPIITYASNSNFDVEKMLHGDTSALENKYIKAREVNQRVTHAIVKRDKDNIGTVAYYMNQVEKSWDIIFVSLANSLDIVENLMNDIQKRVHFHYDKALGGVKFIIEHDFIRGYDVMAERTLPFVSHSYLELISSYRRIMAQINDTTPLDDRDNRRVLWTIVDNTLQNKLEITLRAKDNLTEVDHAYRTGEPILTWTYTKDRHYDMSFITPKLLYHNPKRQKEHFGQVNSNLNLAARNLKILIKAGFEFVENGTVDHTSTDRALDKFAMACRGYNYRLFQYRDRIVMKSEELIQERIDTFLKLNETLHESYKDLKTLSQSIVQLIDQVNSTDWNGVRQAAKKCQEYLNNNSTKSDLAQILNSKGMDTNLQHVRIFFGSLRSRAQDISDIWVKMMGHYQRVYMNMLTESSTKPFYEMVSNDIKSYAKNASAKAFYIPLFAYMLRKKGDAKTALYDVDPTYFVPLMNGDFNDTLPTTKLIEIQSSFVNLSLQTGIANFIGESDELFFKAFSTIQASLADFSRGNKIDYGFYRQNFMQVDVFMRELSYEEITQQVAYDMTNLWSDIGGSIGLFIGASVLSVFEVMDVFIHTGLKFGVKKHQAKKKDKKPKYNTVPVTNAQL